MIRTQIDNHRLIYHPDRVADWLNNRPVYPIYVEVGPTNRCNHRCAFCALDWMANGGSDIDEQVMFEALADMGQAGVKSVMFAGEGEPFLCRNICRYVQAAKAAGMDVAITTNGSLLDQDKAKACLAHLSWIRISLDAGTPKTYHAIHGVREEEFDKTLANIGHAVELKKQEGLPVTIGVQVLILPQNLEEIVPITRRIKELGADNIQLKPYSHHPLSKNNFSVDHSCLESLKRVLSGVSDDHFQVLLRTETAARIEGERNYTECHGLPFFALIDSRGNVIPCNLYYNRPEFMYGNLHEKKFSEIWTSEQRKRVLEKLKAIGVDQCRKGCRLDPINRYLAELKKPHPHVNFI